MANITISQIEDAIKTAMENQCKKGVAVGGYVRNIETYAGEFDQELDKLINKLPFILVEFDRFRNNVLGAKATGVTIYRRDLEFNVFVCAQDLRGQDVAARKIGGSYDMIEDVSIALAGVALLDGMGALDLQYTIRLANLKQFSIYQMHFTTFRKHRTAVS